MEHTSEHVDLFRFQNGSIKSFAYPIEGRNIIFKFRFQNGSIKRPAMKTVRTLYAILVATGQVFATKFVTFFSNASHIALRWSKEASLQL